MSRTVRKPAGPTPDVYYTPDWVVAQLLDEVIPPGQTPVEVFGGPQWLEPCCGGRAIPRAVASWCTDRDRGGAPQWTTCDIRPEVGSHICGNFLKLASMFHPEWFSTVLTNPPFSQAMNFAQKSLELAPVVGMLLRSQWLGSQVRNAWIRENPPWQGYISTRISFDGSGRSDTDDYSWFIWDRRPDRRFEPGRFVVLPYADREYREKWEGAAAA